MEILVRLRLGPTALLVESDPSQIASSVRDLRLSRFWAYSKSKNPIGAWPMSGLHWLARETRRFDIGDDGFAITPFEHGNTHKRMADVWTHRNRLEASETYSRISQVLAEKGVYRHKKYELRQHSEIGAMMQACYLDLLESMSREGYQAGRTSSFATGGIGKVIVWRDGRLLHENGATHRLAAARIVGLRHGFPLRVVAVHRDWLALQGIRSVFDVSKIPGALSVV